MVCLFCFLSFEPNPPFCWSIHNVFVSNTLNSSTELVPVNLKCTWEWNGSTEKDFLILWDVTIIGSCFISPINLDWKPSQACVFDSNRCLCRCYVGEAASSLPRPQPIKHWQPSVCAEPETSPLPALTSPMSPYRPQTQVRLLSIHLATGDVWLSHNLLFPMRAALDQCFPFLHGTYFTQHFIK